jgi:hypothetical protein
MGDMMERRIIYNPGKACLEMFYRKMTKQTREELETHYFNAIGLVQTTVAGVLYYADMASKSSKVFPVEIAGSCPQHITTLALFGDTSAVEMAMRAIEHDIAKN